MPALINDFKNYIRKEELFLPSDHLLLAVSGGIDSVALCELCHLSGYAFTIAHCNFQLRQAESDEDELFVQRLGMKYNAPVLVKRFQTSDYAVRQKLSIQVAARKLRYEWFNDLINNPTLSAISNTGTPLGQPTHILTAHHADDNAETILMNFFKGTGMAGIRGMLPKTGNIVRPLLFAQRDDIVAFAQEYTLAFREDSSNASDKYSRNYIRHRVIPLVEEIYPEAKQNLIANIKRFRDVEILYNEGIATYKRKLKEYKNNEVYIPVLKLLKTAPLKTIIFEISKDYGFTPAQADEIIKLLNSDTGRYITSSSHRMLKNRNWLIISPLSTNDNQIIVINKETDTIFFEKGKLIFRQKKAGDKNPALSKNSYIANLDPKHIRFPLLLRKWKPGDYFYPLGMKKKKKLSRFFIDQKLSLTEKENIWVLESNKKIIWILDKRIDDRFKIRETTRNILQVELEVG